MSKPKVALLSSLLTAVVLLLVVGVGWVTLKALDGIGREELWQDCSTDPTSSGLQGYCVVVSRYPATPAHSERTYLEIAAVRDGAADDYRFVASYPFLAGDAGARLDVDWSAQEREIVVTDPRSGTSITYPAAQYAGGR